MKKNKVIKEYFSIREVAELLDVNKSTPSKWLKSGLVKGCVIEGKIHFSEQEIKRLKEILNYNDEYDKENYYSYKELTELLEVGYGVLTKNEMVTNLAILHKTTYFIHKNLLSEIKAIIGIKEYDRELFYNGQEIADLLGVQIYQADSLMREGKIKNAIKVRVKNKQKETWICPKSSVEEYLYIRNSGHRIDGFKTVKDIAEANNISQNRVREIILANNIECLVVDNKNKKYISEKNVEIIDQIIGEQKLMAQNMKEIKKEKFTKEKAWKEFLIRNNLKNDENTELYKAYVEQKILNSNCSENT